MLALAANDDAGRPMKNAGNPSPVWEKGRDEGLPSPQKAQRHRLASIVSGGPSPLLLSHLGEGFWRISKLCNFALH